MIETCCVHVKETSPRADNDASDVLQHLIIERKIVLVKDYGRKIAKDCGRKIVKERLLKMDCE